MRRAAPTLVLLGIIAVAANGSAQTSPAPSPSPPVSAPTTPSSKDPLDYTTLTHTVSIDSLRAGSHDPTGTNDYYFTVTMYGLLNSSEERNIDFAARKKIVVDQGHFGDTVIDALAVWRPDEKLKNYKDLKIDGNAIRELAARTMTEYQVPESEISVLVEILMFEKNKRFFFLGDDTMVAKTSYYPIPATKFDAPLRSNQTLAITDDKGTLVKLSVRYEK